jgi:hypothetical protein
MMTDMPHLMPDSTIVMSGLGWRLALITEEMAAAMVADLVVAKKKKTYRSRLQTV